MPAKIVVSERNRRYHMAHRERLVARMARHRAIRKSGPYAIEWAVKKLLSDAKRRAERKGMRFDLELLSLNKPTHCPIFGFELVYQASGKRLPNSASLDRFDSSKGYTPDNVWIISWRANQVKTDATLQEMQTVCDAMRKKAAGRTLDGVTHNGFPQVTT